MTMTLVETPGAPVVRDDLATLSLDELGDIASSHARAAFGQFLHHALAAGDALLAAKARVPFGEWTQWVEENFEPPRTDVGRLPSDSASKHWAACEFMRLADYRDEVIASGARSVNAAVAVIRGLPMRRSQHLREMDPVIRDMKERGFSQREIATRLGIGRSTVQKCLNPGFAERQRERQRERDRRRRAEREALERQERDRAIKAAVRKAGSALAEAYAMAERMQDVLGQAHREVSDAAARASLSRAGEHHRKARDEIVAALGIL